MNSLTIVSCYYKIKSKRSHDEYNIYISNLLNNLKANIVIYTSKEDYEYLKSFKNGKNNINIIIKRFEEINLYKKYFHIMEKQYQMDNQKYTGRTYQCYILWNSKLDFLKETIEINPFNSDKFMWLDLGAVRTLDIINYLNSFPRYENISKSKIDIIYLKPYLNVNQKYFKDEVHLGGLYGGGKDIIMEYHKLFYDKFQEYVDNNQFIGCDQQIISSVYLENKNIFNLIIPVTNNITENNKFIPLNKNIDPWFYLIYYYSV
jgi:hypothetical protein